MSPIGIAAAVAVALMWGLQTGFGIAGGILLLHEPPSFPLILGSLVCMVGVVLTQTAPAIAAPCSLSFPMQEPS